MADIVECSASNTESAFVLREERFQNQFRVNFTDEAGRKQDLRFQRGEAPITNSDVKHQQQATNGSSSKQQRISNRQQQQTTTAAQRSAGLVRQRRLCFRFHHDQGHLKPWVFHDPRRALCEERDTPREQVY